MIEITVENGVAEIVLDAPQRMNALDEAALAELQAAYERAAAGVEFLASLPTAQNVFVTAVRYDAGLRVSKDTILVTTIVAIPAMIAVALLLA